MSPPLSQPPAVNIDDAKALIAQSGNGHQCRVAQFFRDRKWAVLMSPYYIDAATDKPRELDLIVENSYSVPLMYGGPPVSVRVRLFIECKYIAQGAAFWFDSMDMPKAHSWIESHTPFRLNHNAIQQQHYLAQGKVAAKLFASQQQKGEESDPIFRAVNQCLNGYIYNGDRPSLLPLHNREETFPLLYPVIVCSSFSNFFRTNVQDAAEPHVIADNFLLELDYAYLHARTGQRQRDFFLIDMVEFNQLETFVTQLETEVQAAIRMVEIT